MGASDSAVADPTVAEPTPGSPSPNLTRMHHVQVADLARDQSETAIGYICESGPLIMAPPATEMRVYTPGDMLIIIGNRVAKPAKGLRKTLAA